MSNNFDCDICYDTLSVSKKCHDCTTCAYSICIDCRSKLNTDKCPFCKTRYGGFDDILKLIRENDIVGLERLFKDPFATALFYGGEALGLAVELNRVKIVRGFLKAGALGAEPWDYDELYDFAVASKFKVIARMLDEYGVTSMRVPCDLCFNLSRWLEIVASRRDGEEYGVCEDCVHRYDDEYELIDDEAMSDYE